MCSRWQMNLPYCVLSSSVWEGAWKWRFPVFHIIDPTQSGPPWYWRTCLLSCTLRTLNAVYHGSELVSRNSLTCNAHLDRQYSCYGKKRLCKIQSICHGSITAWSTQYYLNWALVSVLGSTSLESILLLRKIISIGFNAILCLSQLMDNDALSWIS